MVLLDWNGKEVKYYKSYLEFENRKIIKEPEDRLVIEYRKHKRKESKISTEEEIKAMFDRVDDYYNKCR